MAQISEEQKANMQMIFSGLAKYFKGMNLQQDHQQRINDYMQKLWQIIKDYGTPESRTAETKESDAYWVGFVQKMNDLYENTTKEDDIQRYIHWFMFDLIQITERWKN